MNGAETAREVNLRVVAMGVRLGLDDSHDELAFVCECGCMERVNLSAADYFALDGARLEDHRLPLDGVASAPG